MIVTRRRFFAGSAAVAVTGTAVAKCSLPRLLPAPNASVTASAWTIGLLGKDGRELDAPGYHRLPLDMREGEGYVDLIPKDNAPNVHWTFPGVVYVSGWGVWMPGVIRPVRIEHKGFPCTVAVGTLALNMEAQSYVLRLS